MHPSRLPILCSAAALLSAAFLPKAHADLTQISASAYTNPKVLDFQSAPVGNISGTAPLFTNFGISSVILNVSADFGDTYDNRAGTTRGLWANPSGLAIVDPGTGGNYPDTVSYLFTLSTLNSKVGFTIFDQAAGFNLTTFNNGLVVDTFNFTVPDSVPFTFYFSDSTPFNAFQISNGGGGFGVDNITLEATPASITPAAGLATVPEPINVALGVFAIGCVAFRRFRRTEPPAEIAS